ncbi:MAG: sulfur oxidation c-type cytochrome SoxA [Piscinibacter sp.]
MKTTRLAALGAVLLAACAAPPDTRRSGFDDMSPATQALQRDDTQNPAMLWVLEGEALWSRAAGGRGPSCADCHGAATTSMRGVAVRYPRFDAGLGRPVDLGERIAQCRVRQGASAPAPESAERLALQAYVAFQSRGLPIAPDDDPRLAPFRERGRQLYAQRLGALNLACTQCHDGLAGGRLGGSLIPQGHPTGYPIYRLEWQGLGSLQRRLRGCLAGVRAEPFAPGAPEWVELELFLMQRARGMAWEAPAVRP